MSKTIAAITTPLGNGAVSIIKMSGKLSLEIASILFKTKSIEFVNAQPFKMYLGTFCWKDFADECLAVYFKSPKSFTGEDIVEFQCHGGTKIAQKVLEACIENGAFIADKGEFTKRAFINGKLSLADAEGIVDMINAESDSELNAGYKLLKGELSQKINEIIDDILVVAANLEASLDYPEEMEEEAKINAEIVLKDAIKKIDVLLKSRKIGEYIKSGINIALIGLPNSGKSSLLNSILNKERAIVTQIAGTTRDTLEEKFFIDGFAINIIDTAGIRKTENEIEKIGVEKSKQSAKEADIILFLSENTLLCDDELKIIEEYKDKKIVKVFNKTDKRENSESLYKINEENTIYISAKEKINIESLKNMLLKVLKLGNYDASGLYITNQRHEEALREGSLSLVSALAEINTHPIECVLVDLRYGLQKISEIVGKNASEEVIDKIFSTFCLGK